MGDEERGRTPAGYTDARGSGGGDDAAGGAGRLRGDGGDDASTLREELLRLRCRQLDTSPLAEVAAYDAAAAAAAEARVVETALQPGQYAGSASGAARELAGLPRGEQERVLIVTWYLSGTSPFCRAALAAWDRVLLQGAVIAPAPPSTAASAPPSHSPASSTGPSTAHSPPPAGAGRAAPPAGARLAAPATLIALTPEAPEAAQQTRTALGLHFPLFHDDGTAADAFGIRYPKPSEFGELLGLVRDPQVPRESGEPEEPREPLIPLPACYVVAKDGRISYSFLHPDPRYRSEPFEAVYAARE